MRTLVKTIIFLSLVLILACENEIPWQLKSLNEQFIVIDCILTNELSRQKIYISRTNHEMNLPSEGVTGLEVRVSVANRIVIFTESADEAGVYYSDDFRAVVNQEYQLSVRNGDLLYQARATADPVGNLGKLTVQWDSDRQMYQYVPNTSGSPSMTEVSYDWSVDERYCSSFGYCYAKETVYVLDNVDVNAEFGPAQEVIYFPKGTAISRKKYSLSDQHQKFIRSLLIETEWRGGLFDVQHGNIPTNISNGALGFFAVCMVHADSALVE